MSEGRGLQERRIRARALALIAVAMTAFSPAAPVRAALPLAGTVSIASHVATAGQQQVAVSISATTAVPLTLLNVDVTFDAALCGQIEAAQLFAVGRTPSGVLQDGSFCPGEGRFRFALISLVGGTSLPAGEGEIVRWRFNVKSGAAVATFPLTAAIVQASDDRGDVPLDVSGGTLTIAPASTPAESRTPTETLTAMPEDTGTPTETETATPEVTSTPSAIDTLPETRTETATPGENTPTATDTPVSETETPAVTPSASPTMPPPCIGDCNGDRRVTIEELVRGVNIALGGVALAQCRAIDAGGDGRVTIDELIAAVRAALEGCPG